VIFSATKRVERNKGLTTKKSKVETDEIQMKYSSYNKITKLKT
jgi:hypothetical protein